jgi:hypothetical protein
MALNYENFKKDFLRYLNYLFLTAIVFLYFQDKLDQGKESSVLKAQNDYLKEQNEEINNRSFYLDSLLRDCMGKGNKSLYPLKK